MTDEELDRLLRDVEVPAELKSSLLKIPDVAYSSEPIPDSAKRLNWFSLKTAGLAALAASIIGLAAFVVYQSQDSNEAIVTNNSPESRGDNELPSDYSNDSAAMLIEQMKANAFEIEFLALEKNIDRIESVFGSKLAHASEFLSTIDQTSVVLCAAIQAGTDFGNDINTVHDELSRVRAEFPGTLGAKLAEQFMQNSKNETEF